MCENCENIRLVKLFKSPREYRRCVEYIKSLVDGGGFELVEGSCPLDKAEDENGCWADDIICHVIRCGKCGQVFSCRVNTYRGGGSFAKGR